MGGFLDKAKARLTSRFCPMPFTNFVLGSQGSFRPCCEYEGGLGEDGAALRHPTTSFDEAWRSKALRNLRLKFLAGIKPKECWKCWREEEAGVKSLRQAVLEPLQLRDAVSRETLENIATGFQSPRSLNLGLSNLCNLKCRICGPHASTLWEKELRERDGVHLDLQSKNTLTEENCATLRRWLPQLRRIEVLGGEPLINKEFYKLLELCLDSGYARQLTIHLNTNGTVYSQRFVALFEEFQSVSVYFSIDGVGERFEYQRFPARWATVEKNLRKYEAARTPNTELGLVCTVSLFNVASIPELVAWALTHSIKPTFHILHAPEPFSLAQLPPACKAFATERLRSIETWPCPENREEIEGLIAYMHQPADPRSVDAAIAEIEKVDAFRGNSYRATFPAMAERLYAARP